jgi:beta-lactamase regulating signal transducer with metallopeptidase domain
MTTTSSQLLLTFLLNACWQVALVMALASVSSWMLRNSAARYRHWIWVAALLLAIGIPATTSSPSLRSVVFRTNVPDTIATDTLDIAPLVPLGREVPAESRLQLRSDAFLLSRWVGLILIGAYVLILLYSSFRLIKAWYLTRRLRISALSIPAAQRINDVLERCSSAIGVGAKQVQVFSSDTVDVPFTLGAVRPVIILPEQLLSEVDDEVLKSALGHELIHVRRRDYAFNLVYELLFLPISFHPAAALIRRRIRQTRELSCDEMVAERILNAEVYARSLVQLASSAPTLRRLSVTTTVGIADADILEARIMSLLKKPKSDTRRKRMLLIGISLLLLVPCLAAGSFAMKFDLQPTGAVQDPAVQEKAQSEKEQVQTMRTRTMSDEREMKQRIELDYPVREETIARQEFELKMRAVRQSALVKLARISMDQAIQIATSQKPGNVLQCSLDAEHWEEPGKLAKDGFVFYRVVLVANEDVETGAATHVWVNAVDGSIIRTEKELPRKQRQP